MAVPPLRLMNEPGPVLAAFIILTEPRAPLFSTPLLKTFTTARFLPACQLITKELPEGVIALPLAMLRTPVLLPV